MKINELEPGTVFTVHGDPRRERFEVLSVTLGSTYVRSLETKEENILGKTIRKRAHKAKRISNGTIVGGVK